MAFFDDVKKSITDVSETIVKKSTKLVEIQKLKMKKTSLEGDIKRDFALLGKLYFAKMEADGTEGETSEALQSYERIVSARQAVEEIKDKLSKMSDKKNCRACGASVPMDTIYCPRCGTRFEDEDEANEEQSEAAQTEEAKAPAEPTEEANEPKEEIKESFEEVKAEAETEEASEDKEAKEALADGVDVTDKTE